MPVSPTGEPARAGTKAGGEFFIPDLCAPRPLLVMVLLAQLLVLVYTLVNSSLLDFNWSLLGLSSLFVLWVVLLSAGLLCQLRHPLSRLSLAASAGVSLCLVLLVTLCSSYFALGFYPHMLPGEHLWWILRNVMVAAVLGGIVLRYFYLQQQLRVQEQAELRARLDSLRARIRPHFLFNTLNSIASLIVSRPDVAEQAVEDLAELFRASLQDAQRDTTVADEMRLCQLYLGIEQLRLGERLTVRWQVADALLHQPMPSLLLQPLVENAVYHGVAQIPAGGEICVDVQAEGDMLQVQVGNPLPESGSQREGHRMALTNIEQRLQAMYGAHGELRLLPSEHKFVVQLRYPLAEAAHLASEATT
jgi:two-component system sensor histidine kinase AlgZ